MKLAILSLCFMLGSSAMAMPNEKVLQSFTVSFPQADSVKWFDEADGYQVHFSQGAMRCKLWYDTQGELKKSIRYYHAEQLPPIVLCRIQKRYEGKSIFGVTEVASGSELTYHIILEDEKKWYELSSDATGNLTMGKKLNKSKG